MPSTTETRSTITGKAFSASANVIVNALYSRTMLLHVTSLTGAGAGVFEGTM